MKQATGVPSSVKKIVATAAHPDTLAGSSLDIAANYGVQKGIINLEFTLSVTSANENAVDGIKLVFPTNVPIISCPNFTTANGIDIKPVIQGNIITLGDVSNSHSKSGAFSDGDVWTINVNALAAPISVDWTLFDDGANDGAINVSGNTTVKDNR